METKVNEAAERKMCGYNCAQAVACTYCNLAGLDEETTKELTQGFAVGMGGSMEATCGAIIGAINILGCGATLSDLLKRQIIFCHLKGLATHYNLYDAAIPAHTTES